jgi:peptidoglycan/LPS O-acetylase OafA/YrhL
MNVLTRPASHLRPDIQALRAVAVLAVVAYHIWPTRLTGGFMGVDVFFVISGYLMTLTIWKGVARANGAGTRRIRNSIGFLFGFYARRIKRLAPAATVCLLAVLMTTLLVGNFSLQAAIAPQVLASAVFMQNWFLAQQAVDYLGADAGATAVQHFWSLSIEEQFYMVWPLLLLSVGLIVFARSTGRGGNAQGKEEQTEDGRGRVAALTVILFFTVSSFVYGLVLTYSNPAAAYFVTPARIWELSLGGILVFLPILTHRNSRLILPWLGIALIAYSLINGNGEAFPGWHALIPTFGTMLVIHGSASSPHATDKSEPLLSFVNLSRFRPMQFFGDISYSLYLYHWPLVILVPFILQTSINYGGRYFKIAIFVVSVALAWLSYRFIESPTRKLKPRTAANAKVWALGAACLISAVIFAHAVEVRATDHTDTIVENAFTRAVDPKDFGFGARATQHRDQSTNPYGQVDPEWAQFGSSHFGGVMDDPDNSFSFSAQVSNNKSLETVGAFGDVDAERYILVLGDSYSQQWYPALDIAGRNLGFKMLAANSVSAGGGMFELSSSSGDTWILDSGAECSVSRANNRFNWIKDNLWEDAAAVIVAVSPYYFSGMGDSPETSPEASAKLAATLQELLQATGEKAILIQGVPFIQDYDDQTIYIDKIDKTSTDVEEYMNRVYTGLERTRALDSFEYLEVSGLFIDDEGLSHTQIGGTPVYYNKNHINTLYSASAGEFFTERLKTLIHE